MDEAIHDEQQKDGIIKASPEHINAFKTLLENEEQEFEENGTTCKEKLMDDYDHEIVKKWPKEECKTYLEVAQLCQWFKFRSDHRKDHIRSVCKSVKLPQLLDIPLGIVYENIKKYKKKDTAIDDMLKSQNYRQKKIVEKNNHDDDEMVEHKKLAEEIEAFEAEIVENEDKIIKELKELEHFDENEGNIGNIELKEEVHEKKKEKVNLIAQLKKEQRYLQLIVDIKQQEAVAVAKRVSGDKRLKKEKVDEN